jgi:glutathione reductase (NADPH)
MQEEYDLIVIGGGSGGVATANEAARLGAKCALIESGRLGGTCVNLGCVPKKVMWLAAHQADSINHGHEWGFEKHTAKLNWKKLITQRQNYIARLNQLYSNKLEKNKIALFSAHGKIISNNTVLAGDKTLKAKNILIATGGKPYIPDLPGNEFGITSDGFFELQKQPKRVAIIGAGYIAVELAGLLNSLGSEVHLVFRHKHFLRQFDPDVSRTLMDAYTKAGIHLCPSHQPIGVDEIKPGVFCLNCKDQNKISDIDTVIWATGRQPNTENLLSEELETKLIKHKFIPVDDEHRTCVKNIFAVGDVTGRLALTPVAIAQGRRLARNLFAKQKFNKIDYKNIATVIFSHPPLASCGITEEDAKKDNIPAEIFCNKFKPMTQVFAENPTTCMVKLIVCKNSNKILGCHILGDGADEIMQGFSVAMRMGATKQDFDDTIAIHPTSAEELVTLR